jgi:hypothetical protein
VPQGDSHGSRGSFLPNPREMVASPSVSPVRKRGCAWLSRISRTTPTWWHSADLSSASEPSHGEDWHDRGSLDMTMFSVGLLYDVMF